MVAATASALSPQESERMAGAGGQQHPPGAASGGAAGPGEDSSDSEAEQEGGPQKLIRKVSTSGQLRTKVRRRLGGTWEAPGGVGVRAPGAPRPELGAPGRSPGTWGARWGRGRAGGGADGNWPAHSPRREGFFWVCA